MNRGQRLEENARTLFDAVNWLEQMVIDRKNPGDSLHKKI
jgi:hypothetical protein